MRKFTIKIAMPLRPAGKRPAGGSVFAHRNLKRRKTRAAQRRLAIASD